MEVERIVFGEKVWEAAWRYGSLELNTNSGVIRGVRIATGRGWAIYSSREAMSWRELEARADLLKQRLRGSIRLADAEMYDGRVRLGSLPGNPGEEALNTAAGLGGLLEEKGLRGEVIVVIADSSKRIEHGGGVAEEERTLCEVYVYADARIGARRSVGSSMHVVLGGAGKIDGRLAESLVEQAARRAVYGLKAEPLGVLEKGRYEVILAGEASAAFLHELGHLFEADQPSHVKRGVRLSNLSITVRDDPFLLSSPASRAFDDEAVRSTRRTLVEEGVVRDLLHTRETAYRIGGRPGSARGLFHIPKAMHTTLLLEPGDWREREIVEETRRGILVDGVVSASIEGAVVSMRPEEAWLVEKGEAVKPLKVSMVRLPLRRSLLSISSIARRLHLRISREKEELVAEASPWIRLQGYVE